MFNTTGFIASIDGYPPDIESGSGGASGGVGILLGDLMAQKLALEQQYNLSFRASCRTQACCTAVCDVTSGDGS
jgi:hypothetical protein